jgi:pimeloyl-ACP methyl ester carboxylesterase
VWRWIRRGLGLLLLIVVAAMLAMVRFDRSPAEVEARWGTPPSQFVEVDGMRVHVRDRGDGPALVLIHGSNSSLFTWEGWAGQLSGKRRVIALDLPGHGLTGPHPQDRYSAKDMAEVVDHIMTKLGVEHASLAGNSMGGHVALVYALAHPQRVDKLILVDAVGLPRGEPRPLVLRVAGWPVLGHIFGVVTPRFAVAASLRDVYGDPSKVTDELVDRYYDLLLREGNRRATRIRLSMPDDTDTARHLGELRLPVLILWGARDRWILPKYGERFRDAIPGARLVVFGELGHVPMEEDPVATARAASAFLDE